MATDLSRPIPMQDPVSTDEAMQVSIDIEDPRFSEALVDLQRRGIAGEPYYARDDGKNSPYYRQLDGAVPRLFARASVVDMLVRANEVLQPLGFQLYVHDAWRSPSAQQGIWDFFADCFRRKNPDASASRCHDAISPYVSKPVVPDRQQRSGVPAHLTGGAVDCTLVKRDGTIADMGCGFDEMGEIAHTDFYERALAKGDICVDDERLRNRRTLFNAMSEVGFRNHYAEWWHYDWGDALYIVNGGMGSSAWYGYARPE